MIWALVIGLFVGAVAKLLMPGRDPGGFIVTILIGVAGSMLAYWVGSSTGHYRPGEPVGIGASILGAVAILAIYRMVFRPRLR